MMIRKSWFVLFVFAVVTVALYYPVLQNGFLTDDYAALYRIIVQKQIQHKEFLRPWIDLSFYLNYFLTGLHATGYYIFNLCIHVLVGFMVYTVALDLDLFKRGRGYFFAWTAGFLFLIYPFHNESIVWLSGRLSSLAAFFALLALHCSLTGRRSWSFIVAAICWITGLLAYESIIILPLIIVLMEFRDTEGWARPVRLLSAWIGVGIVYLLMRWLIAGELVPGYGKVLSSTGEDKGYFIRAIKVFGRCFLFPLEATQIMTLLFVLLLFVLGAVFFISRRQLVRTGQSGKYYQLLGISFLVALLPAIYFGVSTRTSEGDRLLYFPSCFLCLLISALVVLLINKRGWQILLLLLLSIESVFLIRANNERWVFASQTAAAILDTVKKAPAAHIILVNAPDEWEGAFIFRNNFDPALVINGIDTNKVFVSHFLTRLEYLPIRVVVPVQDSGIFIPPATRIVSEGRSYRVIDLDKHTSHVYNRETDWLYYWDKIRLKRLILEGR